MFAYTFGEIVAAIVFLFWAVVTAIVWGLRFWKQYRCKHLEFWEDGHCDAHCYNCGKNLGFISKWRKWQAEQIRETGENKA